jgi:hypothetical protein
VAEPLSLHDLADQARRLEHAFADGKIQKDAEALRKRIDAGYEKVAATSLPADDPKVVKAQAAIAGLEDELARTERLLIAHYFEQSFLLIVRDVLKRFSSVPEGSRMRVLMPAVFDMTVKLDNIEIPF